MSSNIHPPVDENEKHPMCEISSNIVKSGYK